MKIQEHILNTTGCTSPLGVSAVTSRSTCVSATYRATATTATAHAGVNANGTRGFWLNAPIFGMKRHTQWTRPS